MKLRIDPEAPRDYVSHLLVGGVGPEYAKSICGSKGNISGSTDESWVTCKKCLKKMEGK